MPTAALKTIEDSRRQSASPAKVLETKRQGLYQIVCCLFKVELNAILKPGAPRPGGKVEGFDKVEIRAASQPVQSRDMVGLGARVSGRAM